MGDGQMIDSPKENPFRTYNTSLASYLLSCGFTLLDIEYEETDRGTRATFLFQNNTERLAETIRSFQVGKAEGNINAYEDQRRKLTRIVKRQMPWSP